MKVLIVGSSKLPIPAVKGGAVPNLIEEIIQQNEVEKKIDLSCISLFDEKAVEESKKYQSTEFIWAKTPRWAKVFDKFNYFVLKKIFHVKRLLSLSYIWQIYTLGKFTDISQYYSIADVVVLPSIWDEPAGMTILEAMACGKALITTNSGGIPEYVGEDNCIIVERNDNIVDKIAEKLNVMLENESEIERLGKRATIQISKYNRKYYYKQLIDILR